jgi:hypothetical protein
VGTSSEDAAEAYVSGLKANGTVFIVKLHIGVFIQGVSSSTITTNTNHALGSNTTTINISSASSSGAVITTPSNSFVEVGMRVTKTNGTGTLDVNTIVKSVESLTSFTVDPAPSVDLSGANL